MPPMRGRTFSIEELSLVLRSVTEYAIFTLDRGGHVTLWNEGAQRVFGHTADEIVGQSGEILFTPEDRVRGAHLQELRDAAEYGRAVDERDHLRKDGSRFYASGLLFPVRDATGEVDGYVKVCRDLSERRQWEQSLHERQETLDHRVPAREAEPSSEQAESLRGAERARVVLSRVIALQEEERRRIARELHDHVGQQATGLHLYFAALKTELKAEQSPVLARVEALHALFSQLDRDLHFLTRELRPGAIYSLGLVAALTDFITGFSENYQLAVSFECVTAISRLHHDVELNLYRIAQEALNNVYKHAQARMVDVLLQQKDGRIILTISDDGRGFASSHQASPMIEPHGVGLESMSERAMLIGGRLEIESVPGQGTSVVAIVPATPPESDPA